MSGRKSTTLRRISEEEYLQAETISDVRHEYVDGYVFAMSGSTAAHNVIRGNIFAALHRHLRGSDCRVYIVDMKVRIQAANSFYYPDVMVSCEPFDGKMLFIQGPALVVEVLSPSTQQTDQREKLVAYQKISSLKEYLIVSQDRQQVQLYRRQPDGEWTVSVVTSKDELLIESVPNGPLVLSFETIYDGYNPPARVKESDSYYEVASEVL